MNSAFQAMYNLLKTDRRYKFEAYNFVRESLNFAQQHHVAQAASEADATGLGVDSTSEEQPTSNHITGQQLCEACRVHALEQFGLMAPKVLSNWGIRSTSDFGEIVYNLIRIDQMRKSDSDRREDFDDVYAFDSAFEPDFKLPVQDTE